MPLLESVPNVSEGRRSEVIAALAAAVEVPGVWRLDLSSDPDHHRTVITLAGEAEPLHQALLRLYEVALDAIDLSRHEGVHPRVGVVDVVPFVPLSGATMDDAVAAAQSLGAAVAERFKLPVYLYEQAAAAAHRQSLAELRRGGLDGLNRRLALEPAAWSPDFGPPVISPQSGATVIGARFFLIAFNAFLDTTDVAVAGRIARAVRTSGGGLPAVRAIGLGLPRRGCAQVSLNLLDYRQTSLATVLARVEREAARWGARVVETELIGLLPEDAALGSLAEWLRLPALPSRSLLERALAAP